MSHDNPRRVLRPLPTLLILAVTAAFGGFAATAIRDALTQPAEAEPATQASVPMAVQLPAAVSGQPVPSLAPMLQRVMPAVVSVNSKQRVRVRTPFDNNPAFRRMMGIPEERINESLGSGVIVDAARGYVLTNHHVIEGATEVSVTSRTSWPDLTRWAARRFRIHPGKSSRRLRAEMFTAIDRSG